MVQVGEAWCRLVRHDAGGWGMVQVGRACCRRVGQTGAWRNTVLSCTGPLGLSGDLKNDSYVGTVPALRRQER